MVGKSVDRKDETQGYIQAWKLLGCSLKDIFSEIKLFMVTLLCLITLSISGKRSLILAYSLLKMHQNQADRSMRPQKKMSPK